MSKAPFPNPLDVATLEAFCHPVPGNDLAAPVRIGAEIVAANGFLALRAHRGRWLDADFPEPSAGQLRRIDALPWESAAHLPEFWKPLELIKAHLFRFAPIGPWAIDKHGHPTERLCATPVWKCGDAHPVRLSFLQLISRLPRAEVFVGPQGNRRPLYFRCTGARGIVAADVRLETFSFSVFQPTTDRMDGSLVYATTRKPTEAAPRPPMALLPEQKPWPPVDMTDA
jgi:hypothetical protein